MNTFVLFLEDKATAGAQIPSPKNRRKIRQPKQYIPKPRDVKESNGTHGDSQEPLVSPVGTLNQGSIVREESRQDNSASPENEVHVLTASQEKGLETNPALKRDRGAQKAKRPGTRGATIRKKKNSNNTVPKKPEDLIREAMTSGRPSVQATKRDAQYRKSYAYKIWKEKANCEVKSESSNLKPGTKRNAPYPQVSPSPQHKPGRAAHYWPSTQYNGTNNTGFYANGKYYEINPSVLYGVHNGSQVPPTTTKLPPTVTTSVIQSCAPVIVPAGGHKITPPSASEEKACPRGSNPGGEKIAVKGGTQRNIVKTGPPNAVVIPHYPETIRVNRVSPAAANTPSPPVPVTKSYPQSSSRSPGHKIPSPVPQPSATENSLVKTSEPSAKAETTTRNDSEPPAKDPSEEKSTSSPSTSASDIVSLVKTTLKRKYSKENVQPLAISFKANLKMKRKLEEEDAESTSTKKSAKQTIFTPLNEQEAEKLANDIYDVNLEYFPFQTLAEKAAQSTEHAQGVKTDDGTKVNEIERVR